MTNISSIMSKDPICANEDSTISFAIALMVKHSVGSVFIVNNDSVPHGILTERELLSEIAAHSRVRGTLSVTDIMSRSFILITPTTKVRDAARRMLDEKVRLAVAKKSGKLMGVVTTTDFLRFFNSTAKDYAIEDAIHKKVATLEFSRPVVDAIKLMEEKRVGSVIVTRAALPFGIISERDLLRILSKGRKKDFGSVTLERVATQPLISAPYGVMAREASSIMLARKIKRLPIFKGDKLIGVVTTKDLVRGYCASIQSRLVKTEVMKIR